MGMGMGVDIDRIDSFLSSANTLLVRKKADDLQKKRLEKDLREHKKQLKELSEQLNVVTNAVNILREISDDSVRQFYTVITNSVNNTLERIFKSTTRKIKLQESTQGAYPQLEIQIYTANGIQRSLKDDCGHGIMQLISLLCNLSLIVVNGSRRLYVIDETLSGLASDAKEVLDDILWSFTEIGFQFIISEHGYVPRGAKVYKLAIAGTTSSIVDTYINQKGEYARIKVTDENTETETGNVLSL